MEHQNKRRAILGRPGRHKVLYFCGLAYTLCLFSILGISMDLNNKTGAEDSGQLKEAVDFVDSSVVREAPRIALTFDDGPNAQCTGRLLDGLKKRGVKATFFLIGMNAKDNPDLVKRIYEEGHLIGNHTYHHVDITKKSDEEARKEIEDTDKVISSVTGEHVEYMRPPFGVWQKNLELEMDARLDDREYR